MLLNAPAKINLTLKILSRRADGYHEISSMMCAIRLFDTVEISLERKGAPAARPSVRVSADMPGVPNGPANLAYRAAESALGAANSSVSSVEILLTKRIPAAAGLAGGSADAAAVLLGLSKTLMPDAGLADVAELGAELGADIPFCIYACAAANPALGYGGASFMLAEGIGDILTPVKDPEGAGVLLVKPQIEIPTNEVYALYDRQDTVAPSSDNDLEEPCAGNWPVVADTLKRLKAICAEEGAGAAKVQLSGSGPAVFAYFEGIGTAASVRIHERAETAFPGMFVYLTETL